MYEQTIRIDRSVLDVYDFLMDADRAWQFVPYFIKTWSTNWTEKGWPTEFRAIVGLTKEISYETNILISERDRGHSVSYRSEDPPQTATYNLVPSADGTVVTARHSPWQIPGTEFFQVGLDAFYLRYLNDVMLSMKRHIESQPPSTVPTVFLSYRRSAAGYVAGRLVESLTQEFGPNSVFQDRLSIDAGQDAQERVELEIERCVASIVLIHPGWIDELEARERDGVRDWVREEVQRALGLGKPVMPVFLSDVKEDEIRGRLPSDLSKLNDFQWQRLGRDPEFPGDIDRIVRSVWASVRLEEPRFETARGKPVPDWDGGGLTGLSDVLARVSSFYGAAFGSIFDRIAMGGPGSEVPGDRAER